MKNYDISIEALSTQEEVQNTYLEQLVTVHLCHLRSFYLTTM